MTQTTLNGTTNGTIHPDVSRTWRDAVAVATQRAIDALDASLEERIVKAQDLVFEGHVTMLEDGQSALVTSSCDHEITYDVNGSCPCPDAKNNAPSGGLCKHRLAVMIYRKACSFLRERKTELDAVANAQRLPEAPVSVNAFVQLCGTKVQVTLRGTDAASVLAEMANVLAASNPAPQLDDAVDVPALPAAPSVPTCPIHNAPMKASKFGGMYCPRRLDDGTFCKEHAA